MTLSGGCFLLDVHIKLGGLRVFLGAVLEGFPLVLYLVSSDVRVVGGFLVDNVEVLGITEVELLGIPGAYMEVIITVLVLFLTDAGFKELVGWLGTGLRL